MAMIRPETEMKDSGVKYIGLIPRTWKIVQLKYCTDCLDGKRVPIDASLRKSGIYPYWGAGRIMDYVDDYIFDERLVLLGEDGAPFFDDFRPVSHLIDGKVWVNNHIHVLRTKDNVVDSYLVHALNSVDYHEYINGSILNKLTQSNMNRIKIPLPSYIEQQAIADYLDETCSKIDEIIAEAKASIDEYKELKQSVIFEAVTKGLDKNVEMKDSGVEWIGETPNSWNIRMLNQYVSQVKCKNLDLSETNLLSLSYGKIKRKNINSNNGLLPESFDNYNVVDENDIVLRLTDLQNDHKSLRVGLVTERGIITSAYVTIRPKQINAAYLALLLHAFDYKKGFYGMGSGIRQGLTFDGVKSLKIVVPSVFEQDDIVKHVMKMTDKCNSLIAEKESLIADLEAYKKSLIYEVVTGKRRVV